MTILRMCFCRREVCKIASSAVVTFLLHRFCDSALTLQHQSVQFSGIVEVWCNVVALSLLAPWPHTIISSTAWKMLQVLMLCKFLT